MLRGLSSLLRSSWAGGDAGANESERARTKKSCFRMAFTLTYRMDAYQRGIQWE